MAAMRAVLRLVSFETKGAATRIGALLENGSVVDLTAGNPTLPNCARKFIAGGEELKQAARAVIDSGKNRIDAKDVRLRAPIHNPEKIICIGLNYLDHAKECNLPLPSEPVMFNKFNNTICGPEDNIILPKISQQVDFEAELVAVVGKSGRNIPVERAMEHIFGFTIGHDVSARDWQIGRPGGQWMV